MITISEPNSIPEIFYGEFRSLVDNNKNFYVGRHYNASFHNERVFERVGVYLAIPILKKVNNLNSCEEYNFISEKSKSLADLLNKKSFYNSLPDSPYYLNFESGKFDISGAYGVYPRGQINENLDSRYIFLKVVPVSWDEYFDISKFNFDSEEKRIIKNFGIVREGYKIIGTISEKDKMNHPIFSKGQLEGEWFQQILMNRLAINFIESGFEVNGGLMGGNWIGIEGNSTILDENKYPSTNLSFYYSCKKR